MSPKTRSWRACEIWFGRDVCKEKLGLELVSRRSQAQCVDLESSSSGTVKRVIQACAVVQANISGLCVPGGLGMQMCSHGYMGNFSSLRILAAPNSLVAFSQKGIGLFSILGVPQNRDSRDGLWAWVPGISRQVLVFGTRGVPGLQCGILVVHLRGHI